ncbi:MAG: RNA polymerase subunit sigma, partial [Synechococcaceae bacterium WBB_32_011]|nr:RNA polymerase subunit sigma [Synechococcaceae bacterium WBB_32_011]
MGTPLGARTEGEQPSVRPAQLRSGSRTGGRLSTDSIGWYLSNIGRVPLLTAAEEIELAHQVQQMKQLSEIAEEERTPRQRHQVRMGCRARDRMMAANLRLVVSVAK